MTTYNIYLDRIEVIGDKGTIMTCSLRYKLLFLSSDLYNVFLSRRLGKGQTYRRMSFIIHDLVHIIDKIEDVNEEHVVAILRNSLSFLRRYEFTDFQINILNHV